jgi:hypothetical protein
MRTVNHDALSVERLKIRSKMGIISQAASGTNARFVAVYIPPSPNMPDILTIFGRRRLLYTSLG